MLETPDRADAADERAERAFRDALSRHAAAVDPVPLAPRRRRRRWLPVAAAAAAVALVVGVAWTVGTRSDGGADTPEPRGADTSSPQPDGPSGDTRTVGFLDVEVEVPASWTDEYAPTDQWCIAGGEDGPTRDDFPTAPYVARDVSSAGSTLVGCGGVDAPAPFPQVPTRFWTPHLRMLPADQTSVDEGVVGFEHWTLITRVVGSVAVQVLIEGKQPLAGEIVASAAVREADELGCESSSPIQAPEFVRPEPFDLDAVASVDEIAVCLYSRGTIAPAGLVGSQVLRGVAAQAELDALRDAPVGGGPEDPESCIDTQYGDHGIVLRLRDSGEPLGDLHVYYDWCFGNGIDDGTTRRALTTENCPPLWGGSVVQHGGSGAPWRVCHPD